MFSRARSLHAVVRYGLSLSALLLAAPMLAQSTSLSGAVLNETTEKPLANADVVIESLNRSVRSDNLGNFVLSGLMPGRYTVVVRLLGYDAFKTDVLLRLNENFEAAFLLKPSVTTLKEVDVKATKTGGPWAIKLAEFDERRSGGIGRFITADVFERADGTPLSAVLMSNIPGMRAIQVNGRRWLASSRGGKMYSKGPGEIGNPTTLEKIPPACYMQVVVNGQIVYSGHDSQPMFDVDGLNTRDVIGLEFYTTATTPSQYNATRGKNMSSCGTVVIWTKGG